MHISDINQIPNIIKNSNFTIFHFDTIDNFPHIPRASVIAPTANKNSITIEQVHELIAHTNHKQPTNTVFLIHQAETLTESAANALLKLLEQPNSNTHIAFFVTGSTKLLPTLHSRAHTYDCTTAFNLTNLTISNIELIASAKELISARPIQLPKLTVALSKDREKTLSTLSLAIEILTKTYLQTKNPTFLAKLPKFIAAHTAIQQNGHIKLQLMANLI